jgi:hypothetical protein
MEDSESASSIEDKGETQGKQPKKELCWRDIGATRLPEGNAQRGTPGGKRVDRAASS